MLNGQAVLWAGLHQILIEDQADGESSLESVERKLVAALLSKAAVAAGERNPLQISWEEARTMGDWALPNGENKEEEFFAALWLILHDESLRWQYRILLRGLGLAIEDIQQARSEQWEEALRTMTQRLGPVERGGNLRRLLALEGRYDKEAAELLHRLLDDLDDED